MAATALYWNSAASKLLSNCIISSLGKKRTSAEDKVVKLPMLTASKWSRRFFSKKVLLLISLNLIKWEGLLFDVIIPIVSLLFV
ncbi:hypothetical protein CLAVI_000949 [Candidatus Clavichlamydia salmonicola]|uniref:hypothetical protein n=1 Tax=Candidatus Clavichlamydia salmonicola TaxID=469812 RepID=UPI001891B2E7|nr:hypothetical protein [Candidatus Clavichlamydia salmonicola]MBF5051308.1 hypothetical protein [Candidatus Clavichlamydia salmonicola]